MGTVSLAFLRGSPIQPYLLHKDSTTLITFQSNYITLKKSKWDSRITLWPHIFIFYSHLFFVLILNIKIVHLNANQVSNLSLYKWHLHIYTPTMNSPGLFLKVKNTLNILHWRCYNELILIWLWLII